VSLRAARELAKERQSHLIGILIGAPYNRLLRVPYVRFTPQAAKTFYTIACGDKGIVKPTTPPSGVVFEDGSFLNMYEKRSVPADQLLEYTHHYQTPHGLSIRYDKDPENVSPAHPEHHLQSSGIGKDIRLPTGEVSCEEILEMIFEQFVRPKHTGP
jgi:hypothetical protein